ncbi:MAG: sugar transferase [Firmicutes bacterium]|nr:sugar transferase [Bacillota bacterium]
MGASAAVEYEEITTEENAAEENKEIRKLHEFAESRVKYQAEQIDLPEGKTVYRFVKRSMDILCSTLALIVLLIPMVLIAVIIALDSPGNPIFSQVRLGKDQKPFTLYKFRSMRLDAEADGAQWASNDDPRVTRVGAFLRKTRIDELPQLVNILKGDMSIVGPRPERPEFYDVFDTYISGFRQRMLVRPGLTGYAQVVGGYSLMPEEKIVYDLEYIKKQSLLFDIRLILYTVIVVFRGDKSREAIDRIDHCQIVGEAKK